MSKSPKSATPKAESGNDLFAAIAGQRQQLRESILCVPEPPPRPTRIIPESNGDPKWPSPSRMRNSDGLQQELQRQRRRHAPYLRNLTTPVETTRQTLPLKSFEWRIETEADRYNFQTVLAGKGQWETVQIPHYGPPLGRAVTYYRTEFALTSDWLAAGALFACFDGADYIAHVFLNGSFIGSHEGFFAPFEFNVAAHARVGNNTLVVKLENDAITMGNQSWGTDGELYDGDKIYGATGPGYDDPVDGWHHCPPAMGIYQPVRIETRAPQFIHDIFVRPLPEEGKAEAWVELWNTDILRHDVGLTLTVQGRNFSATVLKDLDCKLTGPLGPNLNQFRITLDMKKFRWWNPDSPWLYQIQARLYSKPAEHAEASKMLDAAEKQFGMRSFRMESEIKPYGRMYLNGKEIRLRGSNTMGFEQLDVMRGDTPQLIDDMLMAKICNMNFLRLTQRPVQREIYEICDRLGLMLQSDLPLFGMLTRRQFCEGARQAREMERLIRAHACSIMVSYINEPFPFSWRPLKAARILNRVELERFFTACDQGVLLENPDRVIKPVDGDYDPPAPGLPDNHCYCCWYNGHGVPIGRLHRGAWMAVKPDWVYGCGEFGAEGLEDVETMRTHYPPAWLPQSPLEEKNWRADRIPKAQTEKMHYFWYDSQDNLADWVRASQQHQAWSTRIMTEAFRRDRNMVSIAIHLFIDAFPAGWMKTIMDVDRRPKPAFFAYRDALAPLLVNLRSDRRSYFSGETVQTEAWICNDTHETHPGSRLLWRAENADGSLIAGGETPATVPVCSSYCHGAINFTAPKTERRTTLRLRLALLDATGKVLNDTELSSDLFPKPAAFALERTVSILGAAEGLGVRLAQEMALKFTLGLPTSSTGDNPIILLDDPALLRRHAAALRKLVRRGATVIALELPVGTYAMAEDSLEIKPCPMGPVMFVSRKTGHPMVRDFQSEDFKLWLDPAADCITPVLESVCIPSSANSWQVIVQSGGPTADWFSTCGAAMPAVLEKREEQGMWRICQLKLAGRLINPVAAEFTRRLLVE